MIRRNVVNMGCLLNRRKTISVTTILGYRSHTVVLLRHGESIWNVEKRFTGWCDVPLTSHGEADARDAGRLLGERQMRFDVAFTSKLERAWKTCKKMLHFNALILTLRCLLQR